MWEINLHNFFCKFLSKLFHKNNLKYSSQNKVRSHPAPLQKTQAKFKLLLNDHQVLQIWLMHFSPKSFPTKFFFAYFVSTTLTFLWLQQTYSNLRDFNLYYSYLWYYYHKTIIILLCINLLSEYLRAVVGMERTALQKNLHFQGKSDFPYFKVWVFLTIKKG